MKDQGLSFPRRLLSLMLAFCIKDLLLREEYAELRFVGSIKKKIFYERISKFVLVKASYKIRIFGKLVSQEKHRLYIIQKNGFIYLVNIDSNFDFQGKIRDYSVSVLVEILEK